MSKLLERTLTVVAVLLVLAVGALAFAWSGLYDIGADVHHWKPTYALLATVRDRSIEARAKHVVVPNLDDPQLILKGAGQYAAMCTGCHLTPGEGDSELRKGMYPQPPDLSRTHVDPKKAFWVIEHGIKMSAMPAWGMAGHDDPTIWSMVAFLQKLPGMTPAGYKAIVAKAPPDEDMDMGGDHPPARTDAGMAVPADAATALAPATAHKPAQ
ncbi:MAG TPA: cytochrome c [Rhodanobacter sp.]